MAGFCGGRLRKLFVIEFISSSVFSTTPHTWPRITSCVYNYILWLGETWLVTDFVELHCNELGMEWDEFSPFVRGKNRIRSIWFISVAVYIKLIAYLASFYCSSFINSMLNEICGVIIPFRHYGQAILIWIFSLIFYESHFMNEN